VRLLRLLLDSSALVDSCELNGLKPHEDLNGRNDFVLKLFELKTEFFEPESNRLFSVSLKF